MTDYPVGTVARATVCGVRDVLVMRSLSDDMGVAPWVSAVDASGWHHHSDVTDIRPLVVLDPDGWGAVDVVALLRGYGDEVWLSDQDDAAITYLADTIAEQISPGRDPIAAAADAAWLAWSTDSGERPDRAAWRAAIEAAVAAYRQAGGQP